MSATISSASSPAPSALPIALNGASAAEGSAVAAHAAKVDASEASGTSSFGALFQQLLGKRPNIDADPSQLVLTEDAALETGDPSAATLAELLPFLERMGLVPTDAAPADKALEDVAVTTDTLPLAGFAPALTPPSTVATAISAAPPNTENGVLPLLPPVLTATRSDAGVQVAKTDDLGLSLPKELSSQFAAALEAASDKVSGTAPSANPAGLPFQPVDSPLSQVPSTVTSLPVAQPVGASGWGQEVGNRLVWMANSANSHAELVLTPPHMGRVEVSLSVSGDQASATFVSNNPAVREALEAAMPRLREALAEAGIQLGQSQVGAENSRQSAQDEKNGDNFKFAHDVSHDANSLQSITPPLPATSAGLKLGRGLVDVFA